MNDAPGLETHDSLQAWRCPMLGDTIPFRYCRTQNEGLPCRRIMTCWDGRFDVLQWLATHYDEDELARAFEGPTGGKAVQLVDLIRKARET